jgi:hypothetical protein
MRRYVLTLTLACGLADIVNASLMAQKARTVVTLNDAQGRSVGTATLSAETTGGVSIALDLKNLPPGEHASTSIKWRSAMSRHSNPRARISILMASNMGCRIRKDHMPAT